MSNRQIKLGAVTMGVGGPGQHYQWLDPEIPGDASVNIGWYIEQVQLAEAAKFDLVFIVDSQFITPDSPPHYLNRLEPMTLLAALAVVTRHIGLVATMTTSYNDPFNVARRLASLDLISGGRSGWNVVTSGDAGAAGNFSRDEHYDYDTRYARGLEFVRVAQGLWDSYEADAFPRDRGARRFLDPSRQHALNHKGDHFQVVGPLNISRSPQGQPVIFQAGDSEQGRDLGATIGEGIFTHAASIEQGQAFYTDIKARAAAKGRDPDHIIVMPGVRVFVGDTDTEAREIEHDLQLADQDFDKALGELGRPFAWHDFRQHDLDAPFPDVLHVAERGFRTQAEKIVKLARDNGYTLRETVQAISGPKPTPFAGSPETVADEMQRWFEGRALDGYNIHIGHPSQFRRFTGEVVPILRERGLVRAEYDSGTLRGNLGLPVPENRYTAAREREEDEETSPGRALVAPRGPAARASTPSPRTLSANPSARPDQPTGARTSSHA
jgi:FMN-dependent oxidoreductase (nitrilotriacetate monooxygenase family)